MPQPFAVIETPSPPGAGAPTLRECATVDEVDAYLDSVVADGMEVQPELVNVSRSNGDSLAIGLGLATHVNKNGEEVDYAPDRPFSVLSYTPADGNPPYYIALANKPAPYGLVFFCGGHWSEFSARHAITRAKARAVIGSS